MFYETLGFRYIMHISGIFQANYLLQPRCNWSVQLRLWCTFTRVICAFWNIDSTGRWVLQSQGTCLCRDDNVPWRKLSLDSDALLLSRCNALGQLRDTLWVLLPGLPRGSRAGTMPSLVPRTISSLFPHGSDLFSPWIFPSLHRCVT